jgi:hypothetical protein
MALARFLRRRGSGASSALLQPLRQLSSTSSAWSQVQLQQQQPEAEGVKKMNLCSAINDALHIAMATDKK